MIRHAIAMLAAVGLSGCVTTRMAEYASTPLVSIMPQATNSSTFFAISTSEWNRLARSENERLAKMRSDPFFGPFTTAGGARLVENVNYFIFPVCNGSVSLSRKVRVLAKPGARPVLDCAT